MNYGQRTNLREQSKDELLYLKRQAEISLNHAASRIAEREQTRWLEQIEKELKRRKKFMMEQGVIVGKEVVALHTKHHIVSCWTSFQGTGRTLCGLFIAIGFGRDAKWKHINGGKWDVGKDCATCMRVIGKSGRKRNL